MNFFRDDEAYTPTRGHHFDAGLDLYSRENVKIRGRRQYTFDTGLHVEIPEFCFGLVFSKSGLLANETITSMGIVDSHYTGPIKVTLQNHGRKKVKIRKGQKISQLVIIPCRLPKLKEVDGLEETDRGGNGFGSTGKF